MWIVVVFAGIFLAIAIVLYGATAGRAALQKRTVERLDAIRAGFQEQSVFEQPVDIRRVESFSTLPWLDQLLQRLNIAPRLKTLLRQADMKWSVGRLIFLTVASGVVLGYLVWARTGAWLLAVLIMGIAGSGPMVYVMYMRQRRFDRIRSLLPDAIDLMVAAIRAGHSLSSAIGMVSKESPEPVRSEFRQTYDEQNFGLDLRSAMANMIQRLPIHDIRIIAAAVLIQKDAGGNLTEILEKVSHLIREDFRLQRQVRVHTAQGRLTGYILSVLPLILGVLLYLLNPNQMSLLWKRPIGLKMLYGSIVSTAIGMMIIRKIVRIRV
jgi:tight adherence protein B